MSKEITLRIILEKPVSGVEYGVQKGKGNGYETIQKQQAGLSDLIFEIPVVAKFDESGNYVFSGPCIQGKPGERFIYIDIGTYAGQKDTLWSRRLKIPLTGISNTVIDNLSVQKVLLTKVPGTGKDGGPNCATVNPFYGWKLSS
jgi:hypothetical protein